MRIQLAQGNLALRRCRWEEAERLYTQAFDVARTESYGREAVLAQEFLGEMHLERGELEEASTLLEAALSEARAIAPEGDLVSESLRRLAETRLGQGRFEEALSHAKESAALASRMGDRYEEAVALRSVGLAMIRQGRRDEGERLLQMSLDSLGEIGESYQKGATHFAYGLFLAGSAMETRSTQELEQAGIHLQRAYGAFLDLDARVRAAEAAYQRAALESHFHRFDEAATFRGKARQVLPAGVAPALEEKLNRLGSELEDAFAERWSSGGDVLSSLREMKRLFQGATDTEAVLRELIRLAVTRSGSTRGCVAHLGRNGRADVVATFGWTPTDAKALIGALGDALRGALDDNRPVWTNNAAEDDRFRPVAGGTRFGVSSLVLLPLTLTDQEPGFLYVDKTPDNTEGAYHQGELHLLTILANLAALSIIERWNSRLVKENEELRARIALGEGEDRFVTANPGLKETLRLVTKVANSPVSILVEGETGTGKGLLAQIIHEASNRREKPFVQINCAALPEQLLESELFGHMKGSFTGAAFSKIGLFKEAERRHHLPGRGGQDLARRSGQAPARDGFQGSAAGRLGEALPRGHPRDLRHQLEPAREDPGGGVPGGSLLPPQRLHRHGAASARPARGSPAALDYFIKKFSTQYGRPEIRLLARGQPRAPRSSLAGQRARAREDDSPAGRAG